ncbi:TlpA family protein disulfide reductase [Candidatus Sulfidibacterium hydrothermale]|uniref:TlpA family protein disulfide reductase n=1 Tax=Candidatus Sulfidibacterium hydrothermale TaxID=2875962 RepID=UPI001F0B398F|nr:TlpA disulfide reductase family protein [Candidatus Sulfidibacterium hydrothermale]UBM63297.1 TlpA family protein disulfide reductase [Candidatus Sulfidibacterium hydrothermale]
MKVLVLFAGLLFLNPVLFSQTTANHDRGYRVHVGEMAPSVVLPLINGDTVSLQQLRGKVVVLQFTASWCSVCRREMPHLESEIWQQFKNKNFILIGVDYDEPLAKVEAFRKEMKVTYPFALDPGARIFHHFAVKGAGVTRNVVIDPSGKIVFLTRLYDVQEFEAMKKKIASLLQDNQ